MSVLYSVVIPRFSGSRLALTERAQVENFIQLLNSFKTSAVINNQVIRLFLKDEGQLVYQDASGEHRVELPFQGISLYPELIEFSPVGIMRPFEIEFSGKHSLYELTWEDDQIIWKVAN